MHIVDIKKNHVSDDLLALINIHLGSHQLSEIKTTLEKTLVSNQAKMIVLYDQDKPIEFCYGNLSIGLESKGYYYWINEFFYSIIL